MISPWIAHISLVLFILGDFVLYSAHFEYYAVGLWVLLKSPGKCWLQVVAPLWVVVQRLGCVPHWNRSGLSLGLGQLFLSRSILKVFAVPLWVCPTHVQLRSVLHRMGDLFQLSTVQCPPPHSLAPSSPFSWGSGQKDTFSWLYRKISSSNKYSNLSTVPFCTAGTTLKRGRKGGEDSLVLFGPQVLFPVALTERRVFSWSLNAGASPAALFTWSHLWWGQGEEKKREEISKQEIPPLLSSQQPLFLVLWF